ncbi:sucrase ferredoxin [Streptomyces sp. SID5785]|uniref:sucrase ferredoxin n=1 Tax=Streptomyces sp. SID5785 TaxID=2690309 RepID=UPI0013619B34|nr:sucrase ferredoxin [Streptomyces sp. SID5785]
MTAAERFFCADSARTRGDALAGTAPHGVVWILVEYRGGWPPNGFDGLDLDPEIKALVYAAAQAARARVLLIRRHERARIRDTTAQRWAVLRHDGTGAHRQHWGTWERDADLAGIVAGLDAPGETGRPPVVLVCTHGRHDTCCALRGRPVAAALSERLPGQVWECTHVGGDRFAASVVVAPDGVYYGGLDDTTAVTAVEEHLAGRVHAENLRGYTDLFPPQQVAVAAALRRFGPAGRHDHTVLDTVRRQEHRWSVRLASRGPGPALLDVEVSARRTPSYQLTCRGRARSSFVAYEVTAIRTGPGDPTG